MKKILLAIFALCVLASAQVTPNIGLNIPPTGTANWGTLMNSNFSTLDSLLSGNANVPGLKVTGLLTIDVLGQTQCLQVNTVGNVSGFGISCGPIQSSGAPVGSCSGSQLDVDSTTGNLYSCVAGTWIKVGPGSSAGNPGGSPNQQQYNVGGVSFGGFTMNQDCTLNVATGAITCTKTNNVSFATSATTDTTNASNITSGTLPNARLVAVPNSALANSTITISPATGGGLTGGGAISLGSSATLGMLTSCSLNQVLQWNGSAWACASAGVGTLTSSGPPTANQIPIFSSATNLTGLTLGLGQLEVGTASTQLAQTKEHIDIRDFYASSSADFGAALATIISTYGSGVSIDLNGLSLNASACGTVICVY